MMNTSQQAIPQSASIGGPKILNSRRPLQPRSVNASSSPSPAKTTKVRLRVTFQRNGQFDFEFLYVLVTV
jgi:hypothetical protein